MDWSLVWVWVCVSFPFFSLPNFFFSFLSFSLNMHVGKSALAMASSWMVVCLLVMASRVRNQTGYGLRNTWGPGQARQYMYKFQQANSHQASSGDIAQRSMEGARNP